MGGLNLPPPTLPCLVLAPKCPPRAMGLWDPHAAGRGMLAVMPARFWVAAPLGLISRNIILFLPGIFYFFLSSSGLDVRGVGMCVCHGIVNSYSIALRRRERLLGCGRGAVSWQVPLSFLLNLCPVKKTLGCRPVSRWACVLSGTPVSVVCYHGRCARPENRTEMKPS